MGNNFENHQIAIEESGAEVFDEVRNAGSGRTNETEKGVGVAGEYTAAFGLEAEAPEVPSAEVAQFRYEPSYLAEVALEQLPVSEREAAEKIVVEQYNIMRFVAHENPVKREKAACSTIATAMAGAPTSRKEEEEPTLDRALLRGSTLAAGVKSAVLALTLGISGAAQEIHRPHALPTVEQVADAAFGTMATWRTNKYKEHFTRLESEKRSLLARMGDLRGEHGPMSQADEDAVRALEADREVELKRLDIEGITIMRSYADKDLSDELVVAQRDSEYAHLRAKRSKVIADYSAKMQAVVDKGEQNSEVKRLHEELRRLTNEQDEIVASWRRHQEYIQNSSFY